jgi:hypothetical protein
METREVRLLSFSEEEWPVSVFCHAGKEPPIEQEAGWAPESVSTFRERQKSLLAPQLVHEIFCCATNCNWGSKFGPSARQATRRIYRSDSKEVNGELRKLRSAELHNCAPQEFN